MAGGATTSIACEAASKVLNEHNVVAIYGNHMLTCLMRFPTVTVVGTTTPDDAGDRMKEQALMPQAFIAPNLSNAGRHGACCNSATVRARGMNGRGGATAEGGRACIADKGNAAPWVVHREMGRRSRLYGARRLQRVGM